MPKFIFKADEGPSKVCMSSKISLVVPTHNRPHFVRRLLSYYLSVHTDFRIIVIDSSEPAMAAENHMLMTSFNDAGSLQVEYHHTSEKFSPECPPIVHEKIQWALTMVSSPYVALCADDDFIVPGTALKCADFLDQNPDYCCARGKIYEFSINDGSMRLTPCLQYDSIDAASAAERVWLASRYYQQCFYAVFRTGSMTELQNAIPKEFLRSPSWLDELAFSTFAASLGKIKRTDSPYEYREIHHGNYGHKVDRWPDLICNADNSRLTRLYINSLSSLIRKASPHHEEATAEKAAHSSLIAFSKWYYDTRYRDSHNRPCGSGTLERRDFLQRVLDKLNALRHRIKTELHRRRAMRFPETQKVMAAVAQYQSWQKPAPATSHTS